MFDVASWFLQALGWSALAMIAASLGIALLLRLARIENPRVHYRVWVCALIVGWSFCRQSIEFPWYPPASPASQPELATFVEEPSQPLPLSEPVVSESAEFDLAGKETAFVETPSALPLPPENDTTSSLAEVSTDADTLDVEAAPADVPVAPSIAGSITTFPAASSLASPTWRQMLPLALLGAWLGGMLILAILWFVSYFRFLWQLPASLAVEEEWQAEWRRLLTAHKVNQSIPLRVTPDQGPLLCRLPRGYALVVPAPLWRELDAAGRRSILRHELAHYQRGDVVAALVCRLLALPQWFNPASWYSLRRIDEAAEWSCDAAAIDEASPTAYARALVRLGETASNRANFRPATFRPAANGRTLAARVRRLLGASANRDSVGKSACVILASVLIAVASLTRIELVAQESPGSQPVQLPVEPDKSTAIPADPIRNPSDAIPVPVEAYDAGSLQPDQTELLTAASEAANAAKLAYEAATADYEGGKSTLDTVYAWSLRWMSAAEKAPPELKADSPPAMSVGAHRLNVAQEHRARMALIRDKVDKLYKAGSVGGQTRFMAAANFYLAEADRRIAEIKHEIARDAPPPAPAKLAPYRAFTLPPVGNSFALPPPPSQQFVDLKSQFESALKAFESVDPEPAKSPRDGERQARQVVENLLRLAEQLRIGETRTANTPEAKRDIARQHLSRVQAILSRLEALVRADHVGYRNKVVEVHAQVNRALQLLGEAQALVEDRAQAKLPTTYPPDGSSIPGNVPGKINLSLHVPRAKPKIGDEVIVEIKVSNRTIEDAKGLRFMAAFDGGLQGFAPSPIDCAMADIWANSEVVARLRLKAVAAVTSRLVVELHGAKGLIESVSATIPIATADGTAAPPANSEPPQTVAFLQPLFDRASKEFESNPTNLYPLLNLSGRWLLAAKREAKSPAEQLTAARQHLSRVKRLESHIRDLYHAGAVGGETDQVHLLNTAVNEAEREVADLEAAAGDSRPLKVIDPREQLRFQERDFSAWANVLTNELSDDRRTEAVKALAHFAARGYGREASELILARAEDLCSSSEMLTVFRKMPREQAVEALIEPAETGDTARRLLAIRALGRAVKDPQPFVPIFAAAMTDANADIRIAALVSLVSAEPQGEPTKQALRIALADSDKEVTAMGVSILAGATRFGSNPLPRPRFPELATELTPLLTANLPTVAGYTPPAGLNASGLPVAAVALIYCGPGAKVALPTIVPWLDGKDSYKFFMAIRIIQAVGPDAAEATPSLVKTLKRCADETVAHQRANYPPSGDSTLQIQQILAAITSLGAGAKDGVSVLAEIASSEFMHMHGIDWFNALGAMGPAAQEALPVVKEWANKYAEGVFRDAGQAALKKIEGQPE